ncbi:NADH-quinone oxidoreductase subunit NuoE [Dyadobacter tibetensis]|uniref:NADH-quinone oxidoreductase subunit NuoE n=1 Tax=Dyadobacter tibetensis TaxID=1211851 RepID=UPI0004725865|nr:NADH-quinone oxidoreductase subunit NuoE [Dyadobacter tibetensis]
MKAKQSLTDSEIAAIEKEILRVPLPRAACIEAMKIVQEHRGWISDDTLTLLADHLGMSTAELDSIATFYNLIFREPVGRHVILLCDSISCYVMGYEKIYLTLSDLLHIRFGETTADGRFTLLPNVCLGACDQAPAMMIDEDTYPRLQAQQLAHILSTYP